MIVRRPIRGDDEITRRHECLFALDGGIGALPVEHETDRGRGVPMRGRNLARQDHLDPGKQRVGGAGFAAQRRIFQDQHAALGLLGGDQTAGFHDQRFHVAEMPDRGLAARRRLVGHERVHDLPQRPHIVLGDAIVIGLPDRFDIVFRARLCTGFAVARFPGGGDRHRLLLKEIRFSWQYNQSLCPPVARGAA